MKFFKQGVSLALLGASLTALPGLEANAATAAPTAPDRSLVQQMRDAAQGSVTVTTDRANGKVGFVRAGRNGDLLPSADGRSAAAAGAKAGTYLDRFGNAFGAEAAQLKQTEVTKNALGHTVTFRQEFRGVPVFGAVIRANLDKQGDLTAVNGFAVPDLAVDVTPRISAQRAAELAVNTVTAEPPGHGNDGAGEAAAVPQGLSAASSDLIVYQLGSTRGVTGEPVLAYVVEVTNRSNVRDMVFVDADTAKVVNRYSLVHDALDRKLYEQSRTTPPVWEEGDPLDGLTSEQRNLVLGTGEAYWFFKNAFDRDSYDGAGATMRTVNNDPGISCPNANWNGITTNYCNGVTSDDVVAHEWGHAYTEYTWDGIYQWQPGALNESYSDIWGETVDLINGRMDEDEGDITAKRQDGQCSTHSPANPVVVINSPASIAKTCEAGAASFGPQLTGSGITGNVVVGIDETTAPGPSTTDACTSLTNAGAVTGNIALVDRGGCGFAIKVKNAQNAGAVAVLVADNVEATPSGMSGTDASITIPSVRIRLSDGNIIKGALGSGPVNVTMKDASGDRGDSYRWLVGEDSFAFGGAIRDMWTPTCHGDPGKVSDAQYYCATDDGGGVHSNSGVPNHGYALLVDGGDYNGYSVSGIGLDKAAAIYFRAMSEYQTPTTDFTDHADALDASCTDLIGQPIRTLSTEENAAATPAASVTALDCAQVTAVSSAVEFRKEPTQCNFQPLLNKDTPAVCSSSKKATTLWTEDFEDGLTGWDAAQTVVYPGADGAPWEADSTLPDGRAGTAAYGPAPGRGQCDGSAQDFSSSDSITSPEIPLPPGNLKAPKLSFDHYVATEAGYDGGNVKISVNGGTFEVIPASAYTFNAPTKLATAAAGNTNPLAGQDGFTGTDGGEVTGSWGTSRIDLSMLGVTGGDDVRFRLDIGRDGCGGVDGWRVDDLKLTLCKSKVKLTADHQPDPSRYGRTSRILVEAAADPSGAKVPGTVRLVDSGGSVLDRQQLEDGTAVFSLPATFKVGNSTLQARFTETEDYAGESVPVEVSVKKARSTTRAIAQPRPVRFGRPISVLMQVNAPGVAVSGPVKVFLRGDLVGKGYARNGAARVRVDRDLATGRRYLMAKFLGSSTVKSSQDRFTVRVVR